MRKRLAIVLGLALALTLGAGVAWASIPGSDGVIHGCYKTSGPSAGSLIVVDSAASCPSGYTALNWAAGPKVRTLYNAQAQQGTFTVDGVNTLYQAACAGTRRIVSAVAWSGDQPLAVEYGVNGDLVSQTATIHSGTMPAGQVIFYNMICADWS